MENYMGMEIDMLNEKLKEKDEYIKDLENIIKNCRRTLSNNGVYITKLINEKRELAEEVDKKDRQIEHLENEIDSYKKKHGIRQR